MIENPHSAATCIITGSVNDDKTTKYKAVAAAANLRQSCPTLCDPKNSSPPGSTVPGILQAREPEWVATAFSIRLLGNRIL